MTIDELIDLANEVEFGGYIDVDDLYRSAKRMASGVLALLAVEKPCGWDASLLMEQYEKNGASHIWLRDVVLVGADEARWAAVEILKAAEAAEGESK